MTKRISSEMANAARWTNFAYWPKGDWQVRVNSGQ